MMKVYLVQMALHDFGNRFELTIRDEEGHTYPLDFSLNDAQELARFTGMLIQTEKSREF